ncbi:hypothetical protein EDC04DRAFT_2686312 [Pisolithus marmoratus]|nr:hypothetical protein EDC04DRAFT_2686312 [Pisolithus marmoratus]
MCCLDNHVSSLLDNTPCLSLPPFVFELIVLPNASSSFPRIHTFEHKPQKMNDIANAFRALAQEFDGLDAPGLGAGMEGLNTQIDLILEQQHHLQESVNGLRDEVRGIRQDVHGIRQEVHGVFQGVQQEITLLPRKLYNLSRNDDEILEGRVGPIPEPHPNTVNALRAANRNQLNGLAKYLGIPLRRNMTIGQRREEIARFLGVHI